LPRPVEQLRIVVPVVLQVPVGVGSEPVVAIAIQDDLVIAGNPAAPEQPPEVLGPQEVPLDLVLKIGLPVKADRPRDVRLSVEARVFIDLDDANAVVVQMLL